MIGKPDKLFFKVNWLLDHLKDLDESIFLGLFYVFRRSYFMFFCNFLRIIPWLVVQKLTGHKCTTPFCRWRKNSKLWEKIKSSGQALKLLWDEWPTLNEHTARFLGSWKKYFSGFSSSIWPKNISRKISTCCTCIFGCRIKVAYCWTIRKKSKLN